MDTITTNPVESKSARFAITEGYKALRMLREGGLLDFIAEMGHDKKARQQCEESIAEIEAHMSPNLLLTVLPSYTKVQFAVDGGNLQEGLVRDMGWDLDLRRRITTTGPGGGFEFFSDADTVYTFFEVIADA